ncbi:MAG: hypothetical protein HQ488_00600 [Parcubacteria group bacterium]|nr:hypothetical protein [Parcubacteria group bacterium]
MHLKEICAWVVVGIMLIFALRYVYQIWRKEITPTLSMWILFLVGVGGSLLSYLLQEDWDITSGVNNVVDLLVVLIVIISILVWGDRTLRFRPWEKYYLLAAGLGVAYAVISGDLWHSSLFAQVLIEAGTIPMYHTMIKEKRNTESFTAWLLVLAAHGVGLVPSLHEGNLLATIYVIRGIISISLTLAFMTYYEVRTKRQEAGRGSLSNI